MPQPKATISLSDPLKFAAQAGKEQAPGANIESAYPIKEPVVLEILLVGKYHVGNQ